MSVGLQSADGVRSLERGLAVLKALNAYPSLSLSQLATRLAVPRSTIYRLVDTLRGLGYLEASDNRSGFRVTHAVLDLSCGFVDEDWLNVASARLIDLGETLHWPLSLFTFAEAAMVIRRTTHERSSLSIDYGMTGRHMPMTETAAGQAYLAFCPEEEREWLLSLPTIWSGRMSGIERDILVASLAQARSDGFGRRTGGLMPKTSSISVPVVADNRIRCCISVIWISSALSMERAVVELAPPLKRLAREIEAYISESTALSR